MEHLLRQNTKLGTIKNENETDNGSHNLYLPCTKHRVSYSVLYKLQPMNDDPPGNTN